MTVVAYKDGVMASDSLASFGRRPSFKDKLWDTRCQLVGISGDLAAFRPIKKWLSQQDAAITSDIPFDIPALKTLDFTSMIVCRYSSNVLFLYSHEGELFLEDMMVVEAIGAGREIAIGAMAAGASAEQAVEIAIKNNIYCGGPVQKIYLDKPYKEE